MIVENLFDTKFYPEQKQYVETRSIYKPHVTKANTQESKIFPIVPTKLLPVKNQYSDLGYVEEKYTFGIEINVYAQDMTIDSKKVSKRTICNEITGHIIDYYKMNYKVTVKTQLEAPNIDSNVHRNIIRITGVIDTKYGLDKLVIYPN